MTGGWTIILQALALGFLLLAYARLRGVYGTAERRAVVLDRLQDRVAGLNMRITPRIRDIIAQARRADGDTIPNVLFTDIGVTVPLVFSTDSVLTLGAFVAADIATMCHGEGTCGLCRVQITAGFEHVTPPTENERMLLRGYGSDDPSLRLACHLRPTGDISVHCIDSPNVA